MREQLEQRLETLRSEFAIGQAKLSKLDQEQMLLRETLLRISGAIQVLEESLGQTAHTAERNDATPGEASELLLATEGVADAN